MCHSRSYGLGCASSGKSDGEASSTVGRVSTGGRSVIGPVPLTIFDNQSPFTKNANNDITFLSSAVCRYKAESKRTCKECGESLASELDPGHSVK